MRTRKERRATTQQALEAITDAQQQTAKTQAMIDGQIQQLGNVKAQIEEYWD